MNKQHITSIVSFLISGFIAFMVTTFFAERGVAENYTDKPFVAPAFFIILFLWGIGAVFFIIHLFKDYRSFFSR